MTLQTETIHVDGNEAQLNNFKEGEKSPDSTLELTEEWFSSRNKELAQLKETPYKVF